MMVKVSVVMPCFNAERYVGLAIESILNQSYVDFELIVIDDGSTDRSWEIIGSYGFDGRLRALKNEKNLGPSKTINKLLSLARGEYAARMDADDVAAENRLEVQAAFLDGAPEYDVVSSDMVYIDASGRKLYRPFWSFPGRANDLLDFGCVVYHPTVMVRLDSLKRLVPDGDYYRDKYSGYSEDYDLWVRLKDRCGIYILKESLLLYRIHGTNQSVREEEQMRRSTLEIVRNNLDRLGAVAAVEDILLLLNRPWEKSRCTGGQFREFISINREAIFRHGHLRRRLALILSLQCLLRQKLLAGRDTLSILSVGNVVSALSVILKGFWRRSGVLIGRIGS